MGNIAKILFSGISSGQLSHFAGLLYTWSVKEATTKPLGKVKVTVNLSRSAVAALDRIGAKRLEDGADRRAVQPSILIEEAIQDLRKREGV